MHDLARLGLIRLSPDTDGGGGNGTGDPAGDDTKADPPKGEDQELSPLEKALKATRDDNKVLKQKLYQFEIQQEQARLDAMSADDKAKEWQSKYTTLSNEAQSKDLLDKAITALGEGFTVDRETAVSWVNDKIKAGATDIASEVASVVDRLKKPAAAKAGISTSQKRSDKAEEVGEETSIDDLSWSEAIKLELENPELFAKLSARSKPKRGGQTLQVPVGHNAQPTQSRKR